LRLTAVFFALLLAIGQLAVARFASALPSDSQPAAGDWLGNLEFGRTDEPIHVTANLFEFDFKQRLLIYRGEVAARQGNVVIEADEMVASLEESGARESLKEIRALGNVRVRQGGRTAKAHQAVFDQRNRTVTLTGNVELRDGSNEIRGARLVVFLDERRSIIEGGPGDRVRAVLYPSRTAIEE